jgi:cytochrome c-type biogenesis protein CcmH
VVRAGSGAALALLLLVLAGSAAGEEPRPWGYDLANELMSPFCPGRALAECPSPQATEMRGWILEQERAGVTREAVEAELYRVWGDKLRQAPRAEGFGLVAYAIPAVLITGGGALVALFLRRQRDVAADAEAAGRRLAPVDPELERLLDEELRRDVSEG